MRGGRGAGLDDFPAPTMKRRVREPLHRASRGPPPPLRGGGCVPSFSRRDRRASCVLTMSNSPPSRRSPDGAEHNPGTILEDGWSEAIPIIFVHATVGFASLYPPYEVRFRQIIKGSGTPADAVVHDLYASGAQGAPRRRRLAPPFRFGRARLPAFHHGTCGGDRTPPLSSSSRTSWDGATEERVLSVPCRPSAAGVMSPQAGHRAGRAFWPGAARERG